MYRPVRRPAGTPERPSAKLHRNSGVPPRLRGDAAVMDITALDPTTPARYPRATAAPVSRRAVLGGVIGAGLALAGAGGLVGWAASRRGVGPVRPEAIAAAEAARHRSGRTVSTHLVVQRSQVDLGGRIVSAM